MVIGVLKEPAFETRVSLLPDAATALVKKGIKVFVEDRDGEKAFANNNDYTKAGAEIKSADDIVQSADVILSIHPPSIDSLKNKVIIGVYQPLFNKELMVKWATDGVTCFSLDMLPRTTRAQSM